MKDMMMLLGLLSMLPTNILLVLVSCSFGFLTQLVVFVPGAADRIPDALANFQSLLYPEQRHRADHHSQKWLQKW
jgi:hypothetical protein